MDKMSVPYEKVKGLHQEEAEFSGLQVTKLEDNRFEVHLTFFTQEGFVDVRFRTEGAEAPSFAELFPALGLAEQIACRSHAIRFVS